MRYEDYMLCNNEVQAPAKHLSIWSQYLTFGEEIDHTMNNS